MEQTDRRPRGTGKFRPARFASVIVEDLAQQIISGALSEGDVLPTEPALCEEFGFSRTVVREGLKLLEERGLVRVEQGRGTTVQPRGAWNLLDPDVLRIALDYDDDMSLLDDLISVRRVLEREMAAQAAGRLTEAELAELSEIIDQMEHAYDDYDTFRTRDNAFHAIIMRASGNEVGLTIVRVIHRHGGATAPLAAGASKAALKRTAAEHRAILEALVEGDGELAGERISAHIEARWSERKSRRKAI
jgi:DNA-binding FadR family transcriptional regulator